MDSTKNDDFNFTIDDILSLPEGIHMEMIDGMVYDMATPSPFHQEIVAFLVHKIAAHIEKKKGKCVVYPAPFGVFLKDDKKNYLEPDVSVVCDKNKISSRGCEGAPDWVIEVVSPSSRSMDYLRKLHIYKQNGVRLYWIVDPVSMYVTVCDFAADTRTQYIIDEKIPVAIYDDLVIDMGELDI